MSKREFFSSDKKPLRQKLTTFGSNVARIETLGDSDRQEKAENARNVANWEIDALGLRSHFESKKTLHNTSRTISLPASSVQIETYGVSGRQEKAENARNVANGQICDVNIINNENNALDYDV